MTKVKDIAALEKQARVVRKGIIETAYSCGRLTHPAPALSCADICTALYYGFMDVDPKDPEKEDRDRLILSKGHACLVLYSIPVSYTHLGLPFTPFWSASRLE